ncbi:MAG: nucleoside transporter [Leptospiraceae bacterium]|nr:nucleoside transporter [Leptospiraceae bacterium]MDW7976507.1 nucleoside transporter C-terminal domain-containing protein [Leptospiraceae bacterium]
MNWFSFLGMVLLIFVAFLLSENKRKQNLRLIIGVFLLELLLGFLFLRLEWGIWFFDLINKGVVKLVQISNEGSRFLFGVLALPPGSEGSLGFILIFQALPSIVFFSALISVLYYLNIMKYLIEFFSFVFYKLFRISGAESLVASSNIFVGIESILTVRPLISSMTRSELATILTAGLSTVASNVLAIYVFTLGGVFPKIAGHLVVASILSAPAAILFSKILVPEVETPVTYGKFMKLSYPKEQSLAEAIIQGSNTGLKLIFGIVALLLSVIGLVKLVDEIIIGIVQALGFETQISLLWIFGYLFYPLVWMTGVPSEDILKVAMLLGERLILTEVYSYNHLAELMKNQAIQPLSAFISSYILCGFTHFASLAIFLGGIQMIVPEKTKILASISWKSLLAANFAGLFTGAVAGFYYSGTSLLF